jgi:hypothetical protein
LNFKEEVLEFCMPQEQDLESDYIVQRNNSLRADCGEGRCDRRFDEGTEVWGSRCGGGEEVELRHWLITCVPTITTIELEG